MFIIKKKIFLDYDGTTVNTLKKIVDLYNQDYRLYKDYKPVHWTEINSWNFDELTLVSREHINDYFEQYRFFQDLEYMENAYERINLLSTKYDIHICSMGYENNLKYKAEWIQNNLPFIKSFIGVNFNDASDKAHINMSGGIIIDDSTANIRTSNAEIKMLYGDVYSWNQDDDGLDRYYNWEEIVRELM